MLPLPHVHEGTKLWSMNLFCNCATGTCFVQLNMEPSFGDQAHHTLAVHEMKQWKKCKLLSEIVAIITDNSNIMGYVQKMDVDDVVRH